VWPRCDQKTCVKAVLAAGLELVVVPLVLEGDQVRTDVEAVRAAIAGAGGADAVVCVLTTSSCFAPRGADRLLEVAKLCAELGCGHVVNNAYGVQSAALCEALTTACRRGRVDAFVQSTDKNFMVPVGGAIVAAPKSDASLVRPLCGCDAPAVSAERCSHAAPCF
jgi:O-phospho-L-seryl-tRNASec:L-selenocysteinyl-tRNA synthase